MERNDDFNIDRMKEAGIKNDLSHLEMLLSELEEKWGEDAVEAFLLNRIEIKSHFDEVNTDEDSWKIHRSFGKQPK